jgi:choline dehydrogenase-like flavoprotein
MTISGALTIFFWIPLTTAIATAPPMHVDIIIIGGGTAGLALANRLSEVPNLTIAVIEAGQDESTNPNVISIAGFGGGLGFNTHIDWLYETAEQTVDVQQNVREDACRAYLYPVRERGNLVMQRGRVDRIIWVGAETDEEGRRRDGKRRGKVVAEGVQYTDPTDGSSRTIYADKEVILSAGSVRSPAVLELSGVGNPEYVFTYLALTFWHIHFVQIKSTPYTDMSILTPLKIPITTPSPAWAKTPSTNPTISWPTPRKTTPPPA